MFRDSARLERRTSATRLSTALKTYYREADRWFDGTADSIDRRVDHCRRAMHMVRAAAARTEIGQAAPHINAMSKLESDLGALQGMRHDLLTGCSDRQAHRAPAGRSVALSSQDRRWVALESPKFARANRDAASDPQEISERARAHAQLFTSSLNVERSREITAAFTGAVVRHASKLAQTGRRTARTRRVEVVRDFDAALLFVG